MSTTTVSTKRPAPTTAAAGGTGPRKKNQALIWVFLAPTVIGLGLFSVVPIIGSVVLAFFRWDIITPPEFVGFENFAQMGTNPTIRVSFLNTLGFVVAAVIVQLAVALALAILVQSKMPTWLRTFFRSALFFPLILSAASVSLIMAYLFNYEFGLVNQFLTWIGIGKVGWLTTGFAPRSWCCWSMCGRTSASPS